MEDKVLFTRDQDNVGWLTLNRPDVHNALDKEVLEIFLEHLKLLHEDHTLRALVISGKGKSFCSGADLHWMKETETLTESESIERANLLSFMFTSLNTLPFPVISYVHGAVRGGGIGFLGCSDIVIADFQTTFAFSEVKIGLIPAIISPYLLRGTCSRALQRYFLTAETFNTSVALQIGLIHSVDEKGSKEKALELCLQHILSASPQALREMKKLLTHLQKEVTDRDRQLTVEALATLQRSQEGKQGLSSYFNKEAPPWVPERYRDD